jgi:5'(3')-deoxyribonucleotidase
MKTILIDSDGILSNFVGGLLARVNIETGLDLQHDDCRQWDISKAFGLDWPYLTSIVEHPGFCASLLPYPGAVEAVRELDLRHDVYCVTSPFSGPHWMPERTAWLREHFGFDKSHVIHAYTKRLVFGDLLLDDKPETVGGWADAWPGDALLWDAPWNQGADIGRGRRVFSWQEVIEAANA